MNQYNSSSHVNMISSPPSTPYPAGLAIVEPVDTLITKEQSIETKDLRFRDRGIREGEAKWKCKIPDCELEFPSKQSLKEHATTHSSAQEKNHGCTICGIL
jgi:hypothetical protein